MSEQVIDSTVTIQQQSTKRDIRDNPCFQENSQDTNGVILFTTAPNQLNWRDVKRAFIEAELGWVERVDLIPSGKFKKAYIYFEADRWNMEGKNGEYEHLQEGSSIRVYYQENRYFNTRISSAKRSTREEAIKRVPKVRVEIITDDVEHTA